MVVRSSVEAEFRVLAHGICEPLWLKIVLDNLKIKWQGPMKLNHDNKSTIDIAHNQFQHDRAKHVEVDKHFVEEKLESKLICTPYVLTHGQLVDILTMGLTSSSFQKVTSKLGMYNIYSPTWGGVLENLCDSLTCRNQCTAVGILVK